MIVIRLRTGSQQDHSVAKRTYLDLALKRCSSLKVALSNTFGDAKPKLPAFPLALLFNRRNRDFFLGQRDIVEHPAGVQVF